MVGKKTLTWETKMGIVCYIMIKASVHQEHIIILNTNNCIYMYIFYVKTPTYIVMIKVNYQLDRPGTTQGVSKAHFRVCLSGSQRCDLRVYVWSLTLSSLTLFLCSASWLPWTKQLCPTRPFYHGASALDPADHRLSPLKLSQIKPLLL